MAMYIPVPVLWDQDNDFMNNALISADGLSAVVGTVLKPTRIYPPSATPTLQSCLQIKELTRGTLYLNMTLAAWQAAIRTASTGAGITPHTIIYAITGTQNTIVDSNLEGATILAIWKNGLMLTVDEDGAGDDDVNFDGDTLTFASNLQNGDTVGVMYVIG